MATNVEVKKGGGESNALLLRLFSKRLGLAGIIKRAKSLQAKRRLQSDFKKRRLALRRLERRKERERLKKLGLLENGDGKTVVDSPK